VDGLAYIVVSTSEQATDGVSLEAQRAKIEACAAFRGITLVEVVDAGVSAGKPMARRPGGARVLAALADGRANAVIACKLDRLFRNTADALTLTESWNKAGVALHLLELIVDTSTTMGRFFLSIIAAAAELERSMGADRTRAALEQV
jgi:site-specific DNA recombinase